MEILSHAAPVSDDYFLMRKHFFNKGEITLGDFKTMIFKFNPSFQFCDRIFYEKKSCLVQVFTKKFGGFHKKVGNFYKKSLFIKKFFHGTIAFLLYL